MCFSLSLDALGQHIMVIRMLNIRELNCLSGIKSTVLFGSGVYSGWALLALLFLLMLHWSVVAHLSRYTDLAWSYMCNRGFTNDILSCLD